MFSIFWMLRFVACQTYTPASVHALEISVTQYWLVSSKQIQPARIASEHNQERRFLQTVQTTVLSFLISFNHLLKSLGCSVILQYNDTHDVACTTSGSSKLLIMTMSQFANLRLISKIMTGINLVANTQYSVPALIGWVDSDHQCCPSQLNRH